MKYKTVIGDVYLTPERRRHIINRHPIIEPYIKHIGSVLKSPHEIRFSNYADDVLLFYQYFAKIENGKYLVAVVSSRSKNVITSYITDRIKEGKKMIKNKIFQLEYDKEGDILYITQGGLTTNDTSEELGDDVVVWKNKKTQKLSGFTVLNFSKRTPEKKSATVKLPVGVTLHQLNP